MIRARLSRLRLSPSCALSRWHSSPSCAVPSFACARSAGVLIALALATTARADPFIHYGFAYRAIAPPATAPGSFGVAVDALPDGRLVAVTGSTVLLESAPGSPAFAVAAQIDASLLAEPVDPSFLAISPTGARVAVGAGFAKPVLVFPATLLDPSSPTTLTTTNTARFGVGHFDAAWLDATHLALSAGVFGSPSFVTLLDVASDPAAPTNPVIISNIDGASAGVAFDSTGALYTGNGFDNSPGVPGTSETGWIKRFTPAQWAAGANFETDGALIADVLSAGPLVFDEDGDLLVGGGDFSAGDFGSIAVIDDAAIALAITTGLAIDPSDTGLVRRLDPLGDSSGFFGVTINRATGGALITGAPLWFATSGRRPGDLTGDGVVSGADLAALLAVLGSADPFADLNADGAVTGADIAILLNNWGSDRP